jgi:hypothetical protein
MILDEDFKEAAIAAQEFCMFKGHWGEVFCNEQAEEWQGIAEKAQAEGKTRLQVTTQASKPGSGGCVAMGPFYTNDYELSREACLQYLRDGVSPTFVQKWWACAK